MPQKLSASFLDRLRTRIREYWSDGDTQEEAHIDDNLVGPATNAVVIMYRVRYAARTRTLLWMKYQGADASAPTWRHVEPYSFRRNAAKGAPVAHMLYGWCSLHDDIHSFRIDRILDIHTTDRPFAPRFEVEIG